MSVTNFPQVDQAVKEMTHKILSMPEKRLFLLMAPMQAGKTQFIEDMYLEFRKHFPNCMGLYVTSHNHKDFIAQNFLRLDYLQSFNLHCLTLRERRLGKIKERPLKSFNNDPIVVFFDENHFGDGVEQTIDNWLKYNKLRPNKNVYMIGVSATPFSSVKVATDTTVCYDPKLMPSYKSITMMLARGDIEEATPLITQKSGKMELITNCPAFCYLDSMIKNQDYRTAIIRVSNLEQAKFLEKKFQKLFGKEKVFVRQWNQKNPIDDPGTFFGTRRKNIVTIVLAIHKGRMGTTLPTSQIAMVYEYSPNANIATLAQSLAGRCCGHNKINDKVKVFSHLHQLEAYSLFEQGRFKEFYDLVDEQGLKSSQRSHVVVTRKETFYAEVFESSTTSRKAIVKQVREELTNKYGANSLFDSMVVRVLSKNKLEKEGIWYQDIIDNPLDAPRIKKLSREPRKVSVLVDDRALPHRLFAGFRFEDGAPNVALLPKQTSIFSEMPTSY